jgi:hypothetical protein
LHTYCVKWDIDDNVAKTKILVFRNEMKFPFSDSWSYNIDTIEIVNSFNYFVLTEEQMSFAGKPVYVW